MFYSLYVINGQTFSTLAAAATGTAYTSVLDAINVLGGVYLCGYYMPIWAVIAVEFCFTILLEMLVGSPFSFKLASLNFVPRTTHPVLFETAIICATVGIMCPAMSLLRGKRRKHKAVQRLQRPALNCCAGHCDKKLDWRSISAFMFERWERGKVNPSNR